MGTRSRTHPEWLRYLAIGDSIFIVSIIIGVFALVFLEEVPIRLIGACMVLLSGVFLVVNVSARMREKIAWSRPSVSQPPPNLVKKVRTDERGNTRIVFESLDEVEDRIDSEHREGSVSPMSIAAEKPGTVLFGETHNRREIAPEAGLAADAEGDDISSVRIKRRQPAKYQVVRDSNVTTNVQPESSSHTSTTSTSERSTGPRIKSVQVSLASLIDDAFEEQASEPRREFSHIVKGILQILRSTMNARTATFFWYNPERGELVLESIISDVADSLRQQRKYRVEDDVLSHVVLDGQAQIVCDIQQSAECDLLPYYFQATGTRSLAAVPVFLHKMIVGVLAVDSAENDAYDEQTIGILGQCGKLISVLIQSYTSKYDLQQNARTLETIVHFRRLLQQPGCSLSDIAHALVQAATTVVEVRAAGVVMFDTQQQQWSLVASSGEGLPPLGTRVDPVATSIGSTLLTGAITQCQHCQSTLIRYAPGESSREDGYFVAVPLRTSTDNYGALFIEGTTGHISQQDIAALEIIGEHAGMLIAQMVLSERIHEQALIDQATQAYNSAAFYQRLAEEIERAHDGSSELSLVLLQIDRYKVLEQQPLSYELLVERIATTIRDLLKPYHVIGRLEPALLGIIVPGMPLEKVHLLVEQIRRRIAGTPHHIDGRAVAVTVSAGLAHVNGSDTVDTAFEHAYRALQQAARRTNTVILYS